MSIAKSYGLDLQFGSAQGKGHLYLLTSQTVVGSATNIYSITNRTISHGGKPLESDADH